MISSIHQKHGPPGHDRETLSALFDGELQGDAQRFAMKRLGHDPQWRQAFGHWQLLGDALRGEASSVAPVDFAARVAVAVAADRERVSAPAVAAVPRRAEARRRWIGGAALAASVAVVAMLVARPFSPPAGLVPGSTPPLTELATTPRPVSALPTMPAVAAPASPDAALPAAAAAVAVAQLSRRAGERRSRGQSQRAALRTSQRQVAVAAIASPATAMAIAEPASRTGANPFHPPQIEAVTRPWPRAVLAGSSANAAFTASYGVTPASSPSFYPFEPRLPHANDAVSAPLTVDENGR